MKLIPLTQGKLAQVDDEDFDELNKYKWCYHHKGYAVRSSPRDDSYKQKFFSMHRIIMSPPDNMEIDHIDGDKLNNQRINLRVCNRGQNEHNMGKNKKNTSGYKGVKRSDGDRWRADIKSDGVGIFIGCYATPEEAAHAYDEAAKKYHGEFARLNFND